MVFVRAVVTEMGGKNGGSEKKVIFVGESEKLWEGEMYHRAWATASEPVSPTFRVIDQQLP